MAPALEKLVQQDQHYMKPDMKVHHPTQPGTAMCLVPAPPDTMAKVHAPHVPMVQQTVYIPVLRQLIHVHGLVVMDIGTIMEHAKHVQLVITALAE